MARITTIAIIGATGREGSAMAKSLSGNKSYRLMLMSYNVDKVTALEAELSKAGTEVYTVSCVKEASWEADVIVVATPYEVEQEVAEKIREVAVGKLIISISSTRNNLNNTLDSSEITAAEDLQHLLPHSKVVKASNTESAAHWLSSYPAML